MQGCFRVTELLFVVDAGLAADAEYTA